MNILNIGDAIFRDLLKVSQQDIEFLFSQIEIEELEKLEDCLYDSSFSSRRFIINLKNKYIDKK